MEDLNASIDSADCSAAAAAVPEQPQQGLVHFWSLAEVFGTTGRRYQLSSVR